MTIESLMITENEVVESVSSKLEEIGFKIISKSNTVQKGIDIYAINDEFEIMIEAKGGTTSKNTSKKGEPFDSSQVKNHISVAILKAMQLKQKNSTARIGIALPNDNKHRKVVDTVRKSLQILDIYLIWSDGKEVLIESSTIK